MRIVRDTPRFARPPVRDSSARDRYLPTPPSFGGPMRLRLGLGPAGRESTYGSEARSTLSLDVIDIDSEIAYWRHHYRGMVPRAGLRYSDHEPAVKLGLDAYMRGHGRHVKEMLEELRVCYQRTRGDSRLDWEEARPIIEAVWRRMHARAERFR